MQSKQQFRRSPSSTIARPLAMAIVFALAVVLAQSAHAQTFNVIFSFPSGGALGADPQAGLTMDTAGNLYGTAAAGGYKGGMCYPDGCGTVFKLSNSGNGWILTPLYKFTDSPDGKLPMARVIFGPDGSLYGTTNAGGRPGCGYGCGTVFSLKPPTSCKTALCPWTETVLYVFSGTADGTVFELTPSQGGWIHRVIHRFTGPDGYSPYNGVTFDKFGNLYGTCDQGGTYGFGTVFQLTPSGGGWTENTLYSFQGAEDGEYPVAGVAVDAAGNLYGGTQTGSVYELTPAWRRLEIYRTLHSQRRGGVRQPKYGRIR